MAISFSKAEIPPPAPSSRNARAAYWPKGVGKADTSKPIEGVRQRQVGFYLPPRGDNVAGATAAAESLVAAVDDFDRCPWAW
jgi:hypothetical protein